MACLSVRPGKLNLHIIVNTRMDFQTLSKNFKFQIVYSNYMALLPSAVIEGRDLGNRNFKFSVSY